MRIGVRAKIAALGLAEYVILKLIFVRALIILPFYLLISVGYFLGTYLFFFSLFDKWKAKPSKPFTAFRFDLEKRYEEFSNVYYKREQNDWGDEVEVAFAVRRVDRHREFCPWVSELQSKT